MKLLYRLASTAIVACALISSIARGEALVTKLTPQIYDFHSTVTIGFAFRTPATPIRVSAIGVWDATGSGLASSVDVGLWTSQGSLVGMATVGAGTSAQLMGDFRYATLANPLPLGRSEVYVLGAFRHPGVPYSAYTTREGDDFLVSAGFNVIEQRASSEFGGETSMEYPDFVFGQNQALIGPNLTFEVVPEPSAAAGLGVGVLAWSSLYRLRR